MEFKADKVLFLFGLISLTQFGNGEKNGYCDVKMTPQVQEKIKIIVTEMKKENFSAKADSFRKLVKLPKIPNSERHHKDVCKFTVKDIIGFNRQGKLQKILGAYFQLLNEYFTFLGIKMTNKKGYQPPSAAAMKKRDELSGILKRNKYRVLSLRAVIAKMCKFNNDVKEVHTVDHHLSFFAKGWVCQIYLLHRKPKMFLRFQKNLVGSIKLFYQALVEDLEFQQKWPQLIWVLDKETEATDQ